MVRYQRLRGPLLPLHPEDGGSMDLWNVGIVPQLWTASQTRRPRLETPPLESL